jgi:PAS domain S-box-containing protein
VRGMPIDGRRDVPLLDDSGFIDSGPRFDLLVERSPDVFYRIGLTPEPVLEYVSPAAKAVTGYSPSELLGNRALWRELVHPDDRNLIPDGAAFADQTAPELEAPLVVRWIHRDGTVRWTEHRSAPVFDKEGRLIALEGVARDVTARITADEHARAADARLRDLLSGIDLGALVLDAKGRVQFINDFLLRMLGRSRPELLGQDWIDMVVPEGERAGLREIFETALESGSDAGQREDGISTPSGEERRLLWTSVIQRDADGAIAGVAAIAHDVTDVRRIAAEHARLAAAIEQSAESVIITDPATRIVYVNPAFERLSGYASSEVLGQTPRMLASGAQSQSYYEAMGAALAQGVPWTADVVSRRKDGSHYRVSSVTSPIWGADGSITGYVDVARDVSHERELESQTEQLVRERALIADTLRSLPSHGDAETTAALFCRQVASMSDIVIASVLGFQSEDAVIPLALVIPGSPNVGLRRLTAERSGYLRARAKAGPWVQEWIYDPTHPYGDIMRNLDVRGFAYAPIQSEGALIGLLVVGSSKPDAVARLSEQLGALVDFADLAGALLGRQLADREDTRRRHAEIEGVIEEHAFAPVFQPIVDLRNGVTVGYEALTRFADGVAPERRFGDAAAIGLEVELELATLEASIEAARKGISRSRFLHLNASPALVLRGTELARILRDVRPRVVLEITEHVIVQDYAAFRSGIARLGRPVCLAVDDAGAGFASLRHILELDPSFVKLDISLIRGIDRDPAKQALVAGMRHFARHTKSRLIAEGVETEGEATTLAELHIRLAQGYRFGRPAALAARQIE